ncbi:MAG: LacI family DNA-binding transcriptional regulator [Granulicella sp.]
MKRPRKPVNAGKMDIRSVASAARVSSATVSRTINHVATVNPVLAARVWKAVKELNYLPNTQARALVSGKSRLLGLIVSEITNPFFPELVREFEDAAVECGYEILIGSTGYDPQKTEICVRRMLERKVDGVAVMTFGIEELLLNRFAVSNIPTVFIDIGPKHPRSTTLLVDYRRGIYEGVQHLAVLGHRKIAFISGPLKLHSSQARKEAFIDSLRSIGISANKQWLIEGDHTLEGGRDATKKLLKLQDLPTSIMCSNDMTAIGVQHALFEANLKVPEDFSLVGFDDIHLANYTIPPLTTVRMSCRDLARAAVNDLLSHLEAGREKQQPKQTIPTRLIVRQTTGLPKNSLRGLRSTKRQ